MDSRTTRRAAEKAARDLITNRAALVGELGVAAAERTQLATDVTAATDRGRQLVEAAEDEAARLVAAARDLIADGEQRYTNAYTAATAAGWAPADLTALGFRPPRRATPSDAAPAPPSHPPPSHPPPSHPPPPSRRCPPSKPTATVPRDSADPSP